MHSHEMTMQRQQCKDFHTKHVWHKICTKNSLPFPHDNPTHSKWCGTM